MIIGPSMEALARVIIPGQRRSRHSALGPDGNARGGFGCPGRDETPAQLQPDVLVDVEPCASDVPSKGSRQGKVDMGVPMRCQGEQRHPIVTALVELLKGVLGVIYPRHTQLKGRGGIVVWIG